jgi:hypothetical protein
LEVEKPDSEVVSSRLCKSVGYEPYEMPAPPVDFFTQGDGRKLGSTWKGDYGRIEFRYPRAHFTKAHVDSEDSLINEICVFSTTIETPTEWIVVCLIQRLNSDRMEIK